MEHLPQLSGKIMKMIVLLSADCLHGFLNVSEMAAYFVLLLIMHALVMHLCQLE